MWAKFKANKTIVYILLLHSANAKLAQCKYLSISQA